LFRRYGGMRKGQKPLAVVVALLFCGLLITSCATSQRTYQGAGVGAAGGAGVGALIDRNNRWRGAAIGAAIGALLGGTLTEINTRAAREAAAQNQPVVYRSEDGQTVVQAEPMGPPNQHTHCRKVRTRTWKNGNLVQDEVKEVCESEKNENRY
jgi:hypothetical protein